MATKDEFRYNLRVQLSETETLIKLIESENIEEALEKLKEKRRIITESLQD